MDIRSLESQLNSLKSRKNHYRHSGLFNDREIAELEKAAQDKIDDIESKLNELKNSQSSN